MRSPGTAATNAADAAVAERMVRSRSPDTVAADAEVAKLMIPSFQSFQQLEPPFSEEEVVDALREVTQRVNSGSTYEQIQLYLRDFDTRYGIIFRDDSQSRGLVFPQYIEDSGVRLELEALEQAIIKYNIAVKNPSNTLQYEWEGTNPQTLSSKIIDKYNKYKPAYDKQMRYETQFGVDGSRRGGNTRKKNIKRKKRNSQRKLRLHLRSNRRKNKNKTNKKEEVEECFEKNHNNYTII